jgi:hypothetical protein
MDGEAPQIGHDPATAQLFRYRTRRAGATEEVGDKIAFVGRGFDDTFEKIFWFLCRES